MIVMAGCGACGACGACGGCGSGGDDYDTGHGVGTYDPLFQHYTMIIPQNTTLGDPKLMEDDVVGILTNGVLLDR